MIDLLKFFKNLIINMKKNVNFDILICYYLNVFEIKYHLLSNILSFTYVVAHHNERFSSIKIVKKKSS